MEKLKNLGAGPVSAKKEVIGDCPEFSKISKQKNFECNNMYSNFNGITLIALIITVIVMLILVGVTITVALNGGLFETANKAATETQKESERERLTEIALANYNVSEGKITSADDLASKIESSLGLKKDADKTTETKLVVKGKDTFWQIGLTTAEVSEYENLKTYSFTINSLGNYNGTTETGFEYNAEVLWNTIGIDLTNNSKYFMNFRGDIKDFILHTNSEKFIGINDYGKETTNSSAEFLITAGIYTENDIQKLSIEIFDTSGSPILDETSHDKYISYQEFLNSYGNLTFEITPNK